MTSEFLFSLSALTALVPITVLVLVRNGAERDQVYWAALLIAVAGPLAWTVAQMTGTWRTGLSSTLWVTVSASMILFAALAALTRQAWRLTALIAPYLLILAALAMAWQHGPAKPLGTVPGAWIEAHIAAAVLAYGFTTIAAVAALAALLKERALKAKRPSSLTEKLPSVADCELLLVRLLVAAEGILALGLATGMATLYRESGKLITFDHKVVLTFAAFVVIGALLFAHHSTGVRGRIASRWVLLAYLLMTLGYPGVKFVTDVLMA